MEYTEIAFYAAMILALIFIVYVALTVFVKKKQYPSVPEDKPKPVDPPAVNPTPPLADGDVVTIVRDGVVSKGTVKKMPQGLQVFDENGKVVLDLTTRLCKNLGEAQTGFADGSLTNEGLLEGDFWVLDLAREFDLANHNVSQGIQIPKFTRSGSQLSWHFDGNGSEMRVNRHFLYGVY